MKLTFLGTGAADWTEEDWNQSEGFFRYLTSALVDDDLLIDCGPTVFSAAEKYGVSLGGVRYVLSTHLHRDHYHAPTLSALAEKQGVRYCSTKENASAPVIPSNVETISLPLYEKVQVGDYTITATPASHLVRSDYPNQAAHYVIEKAGQTIFWGCDGCWLSCAAWNYLRYLHFDAAIFDATFNDDEGRQELFEHNSIYMVEQLVKIWRSGNVLSENGLAIANHIAKNVNYSHGVLLSRLTPQNIMVAYDGMTVVVPHTVD